MKINDSRERAFILINVRPDVLEDVQIKLQDNPNIAMADIVYGPYDIIALVVADKIQEITDIVLHDIRKLDGIIETLTCIKIS
jgi:DNA-binding Lrp family transcriptional regulator